MILKTPIVTTDTMVIQVCLGNVRTTILGNGAIPSISSSPGVPRSRNGTAHLQIMKSDRALTRDVMLLVTEWPERIVDMLLDVSDEMVDKGRGMYSRTSGGPNLIAAYRTPETLRRKA